MVKTLLDNRLLCIDLPFPSKVLVLRCSGASSLLQTQNLQS